MSKVNRRSIRKDSLQDHMHSLPDGKMTQGALTKPSQSSQFPTHTHLYQHEGKVHETGPSHEEPGHVHESIIGETSGPMPMKPKESFGPRNDSAEHTLLRIGSTWFVRNQQGVDLSCGKTAFEAVRRFDSKMTEKSLWKMLDAHHRNARTK